MPQNGEVDLSLEMKNRLGLDPLAMYMQLVLMHPNAAASRWLTLEQQMASRVPNPSIEAYQKLLFQRIAVKKLKLFLPKEETLTPITITSTEKKNGGSIAQVNFAVEKVDQIVPEKISHLYVNVDEGNKIIVTDKVTEDSYQRRHLSQTLFSVAASWAELTGAQEMFADVILGNIEEDPNWPSALSFATAPRLFRPGFYPVSVVSKPDVNGFVQLSISLDPTKAQEIPTTQQQLALELHNL